MTEPIIIDFYGDCWSNPELFQQQLDQHPPGEPLVLDLRCEGPCLETLGITHKINKWLQDRKQTPDTVRITRWSNPVEFVPYQRIQSNKISHFFFMVQDYWQNSDPTVEQQLQYQYPFGIFIGRLTTSRAVILYKLKLAGIGSTDSQVFASLMENAQPYPWTMPGVHDLENISDWLPLYQQFRMFEWYKNTPISSVDRKNIKDQYAVPKGYADTNASLLTHYNRFAVEIVCETYTLGNTFFPTEKTIRPLMAAKPMLVYGPRYYLARLRGLGFRTYSELWDETYDLYQGFERWNLMRRSMNRLLECSRADQQIVLAQAHEIAMHNRQHLYQICNNQIDLTKHDYTRI